MRKAYTGSSLTCLTGEFGVDTDDKNGTGLFIAFREKVVKVVVRGIKL